MLSFSGFVRTNRCRQKSVDEKVSTKNDGCCLTGRIDCWRLEGHRFRYRLNRNGVKGWLWTSSWGCIVSRLGSRLDRSFPIPRAKLGNELVPKLTNLRFRLGSIITNSNKMRSLKIETLTIRKWTSYRSHQCKIAEKKDTVCIRDLDLNFEKEVRWLFISRSLLTTFDVSCIFEAAGAVLKV